MEAETGRRGGGWYRSRLVGVELAGETGNRVRDGLQFPAEGINAATKADLVSGSPGALYPPLEASAREPEAEIKAEAVEGRSFLRVEHVSNAKAKLAER